MHIKNLVQNTLANIFLLSLLLTSCNNDSSDSQNNDNNNPSIDTNSYVIMSNNISAFENVSLHESGEMTISVLNHSNQAIKNIDLKLLTNSDNIQFVEEPLSKCQDKQLAIDESCVYGKLLFSPTAIESQQLLLQGSALSIDNSPINLDQLLVSYSSIGTIKPSITIVPADSYSFKYFENMPKEGNRVGYFKIINTGDTPLYDIYFNNSTVNTNDRYLLKSDTLIDDDGGYRPYTEFPLFWFSSVPSSKLGEKEKCTGMVLQPNQSCKFPLSTKHNLIRSSSEKGFFNLRVYAHYIDESHQPQRLAESVIMNYSWQ
jgi:hypothetical protein